MPNLLERARAGESLADVGIIDLHAHFGEVNFAVPDTSADGLIAVLDRVGVSQIAVSDMMVMSADVEFGNARVLEAMRSYPERILGYVAIWPQDPETVRARVTHWLSEGFFALKFHDSNGFSYLEEAYEPAYALANERRLLMLFHVWGKAEQLDAVSRIAERYPQTSVLVAHTGAANEAAYIAAARAHPNLYLDLAYSAAPRGLVKRLVEAVGAERVVFGSDCYFYSLTQQIGRVLGADIPEEAKIRILSTNARGLIARSRPR